MAEDYILDMNGNKHYADGHVERGPMESQLFAEYARQNLGPGFDLGDSGSGSAGSGIGASISSGASGIGATIGSPGSGIGASIRHDWSGIGAAIGGFRGAGSNWKVDPDVLESTADATTAKIKEYETALQNMKNLLDQTSGYWEGDSADAYRKVFTEEYNIVADALATYKEYPTRLLEDAGIYRRTESRAESLASALNSLDLF